MPVGVFLLLRRMSLTGDAMAHAIPPGAAVGYLPQSPQSRGSWPRITPGCHPARRSSWPPEPSTSSPSCSVLRAVLPPGSGRALILKPERISPC
ncbi:MAG: metal ABC transporter permease [Tabrizicola sp.]|nr:metal ABC transporter permease [Tabrizicola sp.]